MSNILRKSIFFSDGCRVTINNQNLYTTVLWVTGSLGEKKYVIPNEINLVLKDGYLYLSTFKYFYYKYCVLYSVLLKNTVYGCIRGFKSYVVIKGLGYKLMQSKSNIQLRLGYSHNIVYQPPSGISISVLPKKSKALKIFGVDYQQVKEVVARLKSFKKNSVYKYQGVYSYKEKVKLKDSKKKAK